METDCIRSAASINAEEAHYAGIQEDRDAACRFPDCDAPTDETKRCFRCGKSFCAAHLEDGTCDRCAIALDKAWNDLGRTLSEGVPAWQR